MKLLSSDVNSGENDPLWLSGFKMNWSAALRCVCVCVCVCACVRVRAGILKFSALDFWKLNLQACVPVWFKCILPPPKSTSCEISPSVTQSGGLELFR